MKNKENLKKAKVILLCGQSNAAGVCHIDCLEAAVGKERADRLKKGFENTKIIYHVSSVKVTDDPKVHAYDDSITNIEENLVPVKAGFGGHKDKSLFGPELGMAEYLAKNYPEETFYIVKHAIGGCTIGDYLPRNPIADFTDNKDAWDFVAYNSYDEILRLFNIAKDKLLAEGLEPEIVGICFMQGESEGGCDSEMASTYEARLRTLVGNFREDLKEFAPSAGIKFADGLISDRSFWVEHAKINGAKRNFAEESPLNIIIDTNAEGLASDKEPFGEPDTAHFDCESGLKLGELFCKALL